MASERRRLCWYTVGRYRVLATSYADAVRYLDRCTADPRPYEPGTYIRKTSHGG